MSEFEQQFIDRCRPQLDKLEQLRLYALSRQAKAKEVCLIVLLIFLAVGVIIVIASGNIIPIFVIAILYFIVAALIYAGYTSKARSAFDHGYKTQLVCGIARTLQPGIDYRPQQGISKQRFKSCGHYSSGIDRYSSEDLFTGNIGKTATLFSELHAEYKRTTTDSKGKKTTTWITIFKGVFFMADFNKHFNTWLTVKPDNETDGFFGWIGKKIERWNSDLVKLENPIFEKHFRVHAGDQIQARYILTPDMQERLLTLRSDLGSKIIVSFQNSSVYITIPNRENWFEADIDIPVHSHQQIGKLAAQMNHYFNIVNTLNLNTRIWTKE